MHLKTGSQLLVPLGLALLWAVTAHAAAQPSMPWPVVEGPADHSSARAPEQFATPAHRALIAAIGDSLSETDRDESNAENDALRAFYSSRPTGFMWVVADGLTPNARAVIAELRNADAWGLDPDAFELPKIGTGTAALTQVQQATLDVQISRAVLLYARHARGGRIMDPAKMLNSHLNRFPQLLPPETVLQGLADAAYPADYLTGLHPQHDQFQRLRFAYLGSRAGKENRLRLKASQSIDFGQRDARVIALRNRLGLRARSDERELEDYDQAVRDAVMRFQIQAGIVPADGNLDYDTARALNKRVTAPPDVLRANMEQWRWMWENLGELHVIANIPEYMLSLKRNGETIYRERIVVGETGKQSSIFTRTLKHIVLRPMWRVPESIKVRELWPSLKRGGGLMREYGLQLQTKDGDPINWRRLDWFKEDIRNYEVVQPPGRRSVMGKVKFSFPSQHTIFIHDTPDKYMFRYKRRTLSHGCLRLQNPIELAHILLQEDRGWSADHVDDLIASGPNRNSIKIETRIPIHLTYFTAWVDDSGKVRTFSDIYGHEKRIRQALDGRWNRIAKGRNHLAPPQPIATSRQSRNRSARNQSDRPSKYINRAISGDFF